MYFRDRIASDYMAAPVIEVTDVSGEPLNKTIR